VGADPGVLLYCDEGRHPQRTPQPGVTDRREIRPLPLPLARLFQAWNDADVGSKCRCRCEVGRVAQLSDETCRGSRSDPVDRRQQPADHVGGQIVGDVPIDFCERLVDRFNFHNYDNIRGGAGQKTDPRYRPLQLERDLNVDLCWAASEGDLDGLKRLLVRGANVNAADYDGRTALHLAASEGQREAVSILLERGAQADALDRWGNTPRDDAQREAHESVIDLLSEADAPQAQKEVRDEL
jgi:hypothetical protein